ncbi:MAG: hypothetical protein U5K54_08015 [Cytophagales bacterium]|nr:hypothetical protein [Cytophagales bacterium]
MRIWIFGRDVGARSVLTDFVAFALSFIGALMFALFPEFNVFVISLFAIGTGMATLQVVINPLLRVAGGEEHYTFNSVLAQLIFGLASFISPQMYSYLVSNIDQGNIQKPMITLNVPLHARKNVVGIRLLGVCRVEFNHDCGGNDCKIPKSCFA